MKIESVEKIKMNCQEYAKMELVCEWLRNIVNSAENDGDVYASACMAYNGLYRILCYHAVVASDHSNNEDK